MNRMQLAVGVALVSALSVPVFAQQKPAAAEAIVTSTGPGKGMAIQTMTISAVVESIDKALRAVTVKGPEGNVLPLTVGPDVRNFDQIKVGDTVSVRYTAALSLQLMKGSKVPVSKVESKQSGAAQPGQRPAGAMGRQVEVVASVIAVDAKTQMVTLKGPKQTVDLLVGDSEQFKLVKVGDQVHATYTEALALSVEPAKPAAKPATPAKK